LTNLKAQNKLQPMIIKELEKRQTAMANRDSSSVKYFENLMDKKTYNSLVKVRNKDTNDFSLVRLKNFKMSKANKNQIPGDKVPIQYDD
jgi:predicted transcriptional regulator